MHEVIIGQLWTGNADDARRPGKLMQKGVQAVVDLAYEEPPPVLPRELILLRIPLTDGQGNDEMQLDLAIGSVERLLRGAVPTLVACSAGLSRSPLIAAAAMSRIRQIPLHDALIHFQTRVPLDVSPQLMNGIGRLLRRQADGCSSDRPADAAGR